MEGAIKYGRTLDPEVFDAASLEGWLKYLPAQSNVPVIPRFEDFCVLTRPPFSTGRATGNVALPQDMERPMSMGQSLIAQLLKICKEHNNVDIWTQCELQELLSSDLDGRVIGARVRCGRSEESVHIHASLGVVLTTGGFSQNQEMRDAYLGMAPAGGTASKMLTMTGWSLAAHGDVGIALQVGQRLGADSAQLDQVWGIPTMIDPGTGKVTEAMFAISKPFSFVVDGHGRRFFSESQPYGAAVRSMYDRAKKNGGAAEFCLIFDGNYMQRYAIGGLKSPRSIDQAVEQGLLFRSDTVDDLAKQILEPNHNLQTTVSEWNEMCGNGHDKHFHRGEDRYQQFIGDPDVSPNPCMGPVKEGPFYAIKIFPGDAGTRGGLLTDEFARVLRKSGDVIHGLFAGGNASVALLDSQGAGTTLAPSMIEGFIAVNCILSQASGANSS
jgi:3-oxosteroid 1-dehydrogenase